MTDFLLANWFWLALAMASAGALSWSFARGAATALEPARAVQTVEREGGVFVDIRSAPEFARGHITRAVNLPLEELAARARELHRYKEKPVVAVCPNGMRAKQAVRQLGELGFTRAATLAGGLAAWHDANLPLTTPRKK